MKLKPIKFAKRVVLAGLVTHAWAVFSLKPSAKELLNPYWHREVPIRMMGRGLARFLPALYARFGERGVKRLQYVFYRAGLERAGLIQEALQIDPDDARSLGRILDFEDGTIGVCGIWTEETRGRATKEERYCPMARELADCPEVCTKLMAALEAGTFSVINRDVVIPEITELLSTGGSCCRATIELDYLSKKEARQESPQATHGEFPPVLKVPGLQLRMYAACLIGSLKALLKLATTDIDDIDMLWYEHMRYEPC
jgi:hypothetical protein